MSASPRRTVRELPIRRRDEPSRLPEDSLVSAYSHALPEISRRRSGSGPGPIERDRAEVSGDRPGQAVAGA